MHSLFPRSSGETAEDKLQCCCQHGAGRHRAPQCQSPFCHSRDSPLPMEHPLAWGEFWDAQGDTQNTQDLWSLWKSTAILAASSPRAERRPQSPSAPCSMSLPGLEIGNIPHWQQDCLYPHSTQTINASLSSPNSCQRSWSFWATGLTHWTKGSPGMLKYL